ncbi:MAG: AAA family ATPase [Nitrosomonadaceae bacterium]|nr:AAA family ATPase [Nitrosomonadaceae bacterium]
MADLNFGSKLGNYLRAVYPLLWVATHEEQRIVQEIYDTFKTSTTLEIYEWDVVNGMQVRKNNQVQKAAGEWSFNAAIPGAVKLGTKSDNKIVLVIFKDFHPYIDSPKNVRELRNAINELKAKGMCFLFVSPVIKIPVELEKDFQLIDFRLPDEEALRRKLDLTVRAAQRQDTATSKLTIDPDIAVCAVEAAKGLTSSEADNAFALGVVEHGAFDRKFVNTVFQEKVQQVKKAGLLTYLEPDVTFDQIGGLEPLKQWINTRRHAYSQQARDYGLPYPRGILLCGIPGVGKTLLAKAASSALGGFPLFQLDVGALFGKHVGESEENFRRMIQLIDGVGRCILFIDEVEKSLNKAAVSGQGDSGTSSRSFATLLSWLSDHKSPVFVIATSNDHTKLPPELVRKGRFDELWWIDLPTENERSAIFTVLFKKYKRDFDKLGAKAKLLAATQDFTGAEIEQAIVGAMFNAFGAGRELTPEDVVAEAAAITPFAKMSAKELAEMREKAEGRLRPVSERSLVTSTITEPTRKMTGKL